MRLYPIALLMIIAGCASLGEVGRTPPFTPALDGIEHQAMTRGDPDAAPDRGRTTASSLWASGRQSLLGDRRASRRGDILTVVVEIDESAQISNATSRSRTASESLGIPALIGLPSVIENVLPGEADLSAAVDVDAGSRSAGQGSVRRNEELTLRVAATVVEVLGNGVLRIQGTQEVRVNAEIRELVVSGFVRPEDISRRNEITYDKVAAARISYGGRGHISAVQTPRWGQQAADILLPY